MDGGGTATVGEITSKVLAAQRDLLERFELDRSERAYLAGTGPTQGSTRSGDAVSPMQSQFRADLTEVFERVGTAAEAGRVYVFVIHAGADGSVLASQRYEWAADGVEPQIENPDLQAIPLRAAGYARWLDAFLAYRPIYGPISGFPESERRTLDDQGILSLLILPIFVAGELWGFVGFDDCERERVWTAGELSLLFSLAITLGHVFSGADRNEADGAIVASLSVVTGMLNVDTATLTKTPVSSLVERTHARLGVLVEAHRFFANRRTRGTVSLIALLDAICPFLSEIISDEIGGECRVGIATQTLQPSTRRGAQRFLSEPRRTSAHRTVLGVAAALSITLIVAEVLAAFRFEPSDDAAGCGEGCCSTARVVIKVAKLDPAQRSIELSITACDDRDRPVACTTKLDGTAHLLVRRLSHAIHATQRFGPEYGTALRLVVPLA